MTVRLICGVIVLSVASVASAEPSLTIRSRDPAALHVRIVAADGSIVARCDMSAETAQPVCGTSAGWFRGHGRYKAIISVEQDGATRFLEHEFDVAEGQDLDWTIGGKLQIRSFAYPGVTVDLPPDRELALRVVNQSGQNLYLVQGADYDYVTLFDLSATPPRPVRGQYRQPETIGPGETHIFSLPEVPPGRYQGQIHLQLTAPYDFLHRRDDTEESLLLKTAPLDYPPAGSGRACVASPPDTFNPMRAGAPGVTLVRTEAGVFFLGRSGDLLRVDRDTTAVLSHFTPGSLISTWPDRRHLFVADPDGTAALIDEDGRVRAAALPVKAAWRSFAARDELHAALLGACSVIAETADGGAHWTVSPAPESFLSEAFWDGGDLFVTNGRHIFVRRAGAPSFEQTAQFPLSRHRASNGMLVTEALRDGVMTSTIATGHPGGTGDDEPHTVTFHDELPQSHVVAALWQPDGTMLLATPDALLRLRDSKFEVVVSSPALERWMADAPAREARRAARAKRRMQMPDGGQPRRH